MEEKVSLKRHCNKVALIGVLLVVSAILLNIKYIFTDFGIDAGFQVSMSYRLATGDAMFREMWEPYQMSAFLCAFFIKIYLELFHTTTGIVLYLQVIGVLIDAGLSILLYRMVKKHLNVPKTGFFMAWLFFVVSPKDIPLADYTNMQMWFCLLLCLFLFLHYKTDKIRFMIPAALCLCGAVLSYPSCLVLYLGVAGILIYQRKYKSVLAFTATCALVGGIYLGAIFIQIPMNEFMDIVHNMLAIETSHSMSMGQRFLWYLKDLIKIGLVFLVLYGVSYGIVRISTRKNESDKEIKGVMTDFIFLISCVGVGLYTVICWKTHVRYSYSVVFLAIIIIGLKYVKKLTKDKLFFYLLGTVVSMLQFVATLILTNLVFIASVPYLLIAVLAACLPLAEALSVLKDKKSLIILKRAFVTICLMFLMFRNAYIIRPLQWDVSTILNIGMIVKEGPAIGVVSEYMGPYIQNESINEWKAYIKEGQSVYIIGYSLDTMGYLYVDTEIAAPSLVPTPDYNEAVLEYWEDNPEKYPDVIVASCWYGELDATLTEDSWMMQWIEDKYQPAYYIDGKFWRYYFREAE